MVFSGGGSTSYAHVQYSSVYVKMEPDTRGRPSRRQTRPAVHSQNGTHGRAQTRRSATRGQRLSTQSRGPRASPPPPPPPPPLRWCCWDRRTTDVAERKRMNSQTAAQRSAGDGPDVGARRPAPRSHLGMGASRGSCLTRYIRFLLFFFPVPFFLTCFVAHAVPLNPPPLPQHPTYLLDDALCDVRPYP